MKASPLTLLYGAERAAFVGTSVPANAEPSESSYAASVYTEQLRSGIEIFHAHDGHHRHHGSPLPRCPECARVADMQITGWERLTAADHVGGMGGYAGHVRNY